MTQPISVKKNDAGQITYDRDTSPLAGVSHRMITEEHTSKCAMAHVTLEGPINYSGQMPQDMIIYGVAGQGRFEVGDESYEIGPETAVYIPADVAHRHVADEDNTFIVFWTPAPQNKPLH